MHIVLSTISNPQCMCKKKSGCSLGIELVLLQGNVMTDSGADTTKQSSAVASMACVDHMSEP